MGGSGGHGGGGGGGGGGYPPHYFMDRNDAAMMRELQHQQQQHPNFFQDPLPHVPQRPGSGGGYPSSSSSYGGGMDATTAAAAAMSASSQSRELGFAAPQHSMPPQSSKPTSDNHNHHQEDADELFRRPSGEPPQQSTTGGMMDAHPASTTETSTTTTARTSAMVPPEPPSLAHKPPPVTKTSLPRAAANSNAKNAKSTIPRRPLSSYNLFFSDERERILKEREAERQDPEGKKAARKVQVQEMAKIIGERWRTLSPEWKNYYQDLADEDMKRHKEEKKRNPKDPAVPKRPPTAFLLFSNKRRKALKRQYPDASNSDLSKMLSKTWREAPSSIRQKYMDEATELSKSYKAEMALWRKKAGERKRQKQQQQQDDDGDHDADDDSHGPNVPPSAGRVLSRT